MTIIPALLLLIFALCSVNRKRKSRQQAPPGRAADRERREKERRELAELELEHLANLRKIYMEQAERLERERQEETSESRLDKLDARLLSLDEKLWRLEMRRAKLANLVDRASEE